MLGAIGLGLIGLAALLILRISTSAIRNFTYLKANGVPKCTYLYIHSGFANSGVKLPTIPCTVWVRAAVNKGCLIKQLAGIKNAVRVEGTLEGAHNLQRFWADTVV